LTEAIQWMLEMQNECAADVVWQAGDVMMCDNLMVMHGRRAFTPPRSILAWVAI